MNDLILSTIKTAVGILEDNLAFDLELLIAINSIKGALVQLGVEEINIEIDENSQWPEFSTTTLSSLVKQYFVGRTKQIFDPTASETIAKSLSSTLVEIEGRINYEIEEIQNG